jgi:hypothetical protein
MRLTNVKRHLKPAVTLPGLVLQARQMTDNDAARDLQHARATLFNEINRRSQIAT